MSQEFLIALIAFAGVLISVIASSLVTLWINSRASRQRIAEFRKEWIEELRQKLSEYISLTMEIRVEGELSNQEGSTVLSQKSLDLLHKRLRLESYLLLSLNPDEIEHKKLRDKILELSAPGELGSSIPSIIDLARAVLKKEWDRLKSEI